MSNPAEPPPAARPEPEPLRDDTVSSNGEEGDRDLLGGRSRVFLPFILPGLGFLMIGAAAWTAVDAARFNACAATAEGVVVALRRGAEGGTAPVFGFVTPEGRAVQAEGTVFTNPPAWRLGERATLRYDPAAPEHASPATFFATWLLPLILAALGVAFVAVGVGVVWLLRCRPP